MNALKRYLLFLFRFSPRARTGMVLSLDLCLCIFAVLLAYSLRVGEWRIVSRPLVTFGFLTCFFWLLIAPVQGVYRSVLRFSGTQSIKDLATSCGILACFQTFLLVVLGLLERVPRTLALLVPLILFLSLAIARLVLSSLLRETLYSRRRSGHRRVLIYGAGVAGRELTLSIKEDPEFQVVGFIDDDEVLRGRRIDGYRIWHSSEIRSVFAANPVDEVLLAMPSASRARRRQALEEIRDIVPSVGVRSLPHLAEIASGRVSVSDLREIQVEELLGRDQVAPDPRLMESKIRGRCVMVTGAGGSIGSELCRQILLQSPSAIVLAEQSELALYMIDGELQDLCRRSNLEVKLHSKLVHIAYRKDVERVFSEHRPETVFHAAAYKHVPLVEADPIAGIRNNVLGTYVCCTVGEQFGVKNFTLVSTDKAVRPSSLMGASKRVCEFILQIRAADQCGTTYSAVRFGNVLGSSGSVVPLFRRQIAAGGPITLTHRDATRFFMTIPEAAQLVVQAGAMAKGGEIFLLDMGEAVRIRDLARMMVQLSGLTIGGENGRDGDIDIVEVGLRPGEKIHEELLVDNRALSTSHPRIVRASESGFVPQNCRTQLAQLLDCLHARDTTSAVTRIHDILAGERDGTVAPVGIRAEKTAARSAGRRRRGRIAVTAKQAFEH